MSSIPNEETQVRVTSEGAQAFVEAFYHALTNSFPLHPFYTTSSKAYNAAPLPPDISINGTPHPDPASYAKLLSAHGSPRFEVESFDAHSINPAFNLAAPPGPTGGASADRNGSKMSLLVQVTGRVTFGKGRDAVKKGFSEVFVLVPNWEAMARNAPRNLRRWVILSQNLRTL
ncbi:related to nuclear transport factor 2 domain protein [Cephalotrichum gorgonifer]|uniref:Related to nuclear transport factor 2 domain protein n=1 Tax=Cephalotrichum gorgonifer TaxID=2041049 RepID=A0AAE8MTQ8_9PEZI|nr:related to nuclear transport factor 2 domain protein [Cephalotrichum gorgonifer]